MALSPDTLCSVCSTVDFYNLIYPPAATPGKPVSLGYLGDIIQRANHCQLCDLISDGLRRRHRQTSQSDLDFMNPLPLYTADGLEVDTPRQVPGELPSILSGKPIQCSVRPAFFCFQMPGGEESSSREIPVNRLTIQLDPCPWMTHTSRDSVTLQAHWNHDEEKTQQISYSDENEKFAASSQSVDQPIALSGSGRKVAPFMDIHRLRNWLQTCERGHGTQCSVPVWLGSGTEEQLPSLRVIDVQNNCIIDAPDACRFIALSYVWGDSRADIEKRVERSTTKENLEKLKGPGGLNTISLPRTVTDAMALVAALGERYLWVDALCIVQDDMNEMVHHIARMDLIYSKALLSLIVAAGSGADAGIPGIGDGRRDVFFKRVPVSPNGLGVIPTASLNASRGLQFSPWNSRGWTFQERLLSRRSLIITQDLVFWNCEASTWNEETILEPETPPVWVLPQALGCNDEWDDGYPKFSRDVLPIYINQYSTREFSYQSDALPAFKGLARRYEYRTGDKLHWGVECARFDQSLLWRHGMKRLTAPCYLALENGSIQQVPYPSWSWMGWSGLKGGNLFNERLYERTIDGFSRSELQFYSLISDGSLKRIGQDDGSQVSDQDSPNSPNDEDPINQARRLWKGDTSIHGRISFSSTGTLDLTSLAESLSINNQTEPKEPVNPGATPRGPVHDTGRLVFRTSHAKMLSAITYPSEKIFIQVGDTGLNITAEFSDLSMFESSSRENRRFRPANQGQDSDNVLTDATGTDNEDADPSQTSSNSERISDQKVLIDYIVISRHYPIGQSEDIGMLNLMAVKWSETEPAVASRIGITEIDEQDWLKIDRVWRTVILE